MTRNVLIVAMFALFALACSSSKGTLAAMRIADTGAMITLAEALAIAEAEVPGGFAVEVELEIEDDDENEPPAYEVVLYVAADQTLTEVEVHALSGEVLEVEVEDDGDEDDD